MIPEAKDLEPGESFSSIEEVLSNGFPSSRYSMTAIFVPSRSASPNTFELDMTYNPDDNSTIFTPCVISPAYQREMLELLLNPHGTSESAPPGASTVSSSSTLVTNSPSTGPHALGSDADAIDGDDEEIVYMKDDYAARHFPALIHTETLKTEDLKTKRNNGASTVADSPVVEVCTQAHPKGVIDLKADEMSRLLSRTPPPIPAAPRSVTPRAQASTFHLHIPPLPSRPPPPAPVIYSPTPIQLPKAVSFGPDEVIVDVPFRSASAARAPSALKSKFARSASRGAEISAPDAAPPTYNAIGAANGTVCACPIHGHFPAPIQIAFPTRSSAESSDEVASDSLEVVGGSEKAKKSAGVFNVIRRAVGLRRSKTHKSHASVDTMPAAVVFTPAFDSVSIKSRGSGKGNVLRKQGPAPRAHSSSASMFNETLSASESQTAPRIKSKAFSLRSGKRRNGTESATKTGAVVPSNKHVHRRSVSMSGFVLPSLEDPDHDAILEAAGQRLLDMPHGQWMYKPQPLETSESEEAAMAGFVLERHVQVE